MASKHRGVAAHCLHVIAGRGRRQPILLLCCQLSQILRACADLTLVCFGQHAVLLHIFHSHRCCPLHCNNSSISLGLLFLCSSSVARVELLEEEHRGDNFAADFYHLKF
jgi:hypothetical protein